MVRSQVVDKVRQWFVNPAALGYLALVVAVLGWIAVDALFVTHEDASMAGVWAFVVTGPVSWIFLMLPEPLVLAGVVVGAVVQAGVIGALYRAATRGRGMGAALTGR
ncbi:SCO4225 family membrane protein [Streptomyces niveiscabiei]|uniref:SCO4225 family membrane protein n=1 Tax=Streptomyces niveiscabiei TaxID=164115 RepID=A0ABW9I320_9ACTN